MIQTSDSEFETKEKMWKSTAKLLNSLKASCTFMQNKHRETSVDAVCGLSSFYNGEFTMEHEINSEKLKM